MKNIFTLAFCLLPFATLSAQTPGKVLVIGIDGCRADALRMADAPEIHTLLDHAVYSYDALTRFPTWSGPGWSSMCTGVWSEKHGVLDNSFFGSQFDVYPHFIQRAETYNPALHSASIVHWSPINTEINTLCDIEINVPTDADVRDEAVAYLTNNNPDILFVAFDDVDHAGHTYGFDPSIPEYMELISITARFVGDIMAALQARPNFIAENWLVLLTPDHGGNLEGHGGASLEERNIFFVAWQPGSAPIELRKDSVVFEQAKGLQFNGTDQYLRPAESNLFEFGDSQDFSIEMRVRYSDLSGDAAFISNKDWDSGLNAGWVLSTPYGDQTHWKANISDGVIRKDVTGSYISDGQWHHLTVTFDRDGLMSLYEDGQLSGQTDISGIGNIDTGLPMVIGQDGTLQYPYFFNGSMAEVRIWNTVLAPETVASYACGPLSANHPNSANLLAYWKMDEGSGNTVSNTVSGAPNGEIQGATATWTATPGNVICLDFSQTPRIVDIAVTALTHLCVPIDSAWNLDGKAYVESCASVGAHEAELDGDVLEITPNPTAAFVQLHWANNPPTELAVVSIYSAQGRLVSTFNMRGDAAEISLKEYPNGWYFVRAAAQDGHVVMTRILKIQE